MSRLRITIVLLLLIAGVATVHAEPVLLKSIPATSWARPYVPVMILHTALAGMGARCSYEQLLVTSGAAFRMCWRPGDFNFPAIYLYQQDPVAMAGAAAGAQVERVQYPTADAAFEAVMESIDAGIPVISWGDGTMHWQVLCGYDKATRTVFRRTIDTGKDPEQKPLDCLKPPYPTAPFELWLLAYDPNKAVRTDWPLVIANILRLAQWPDAERTPGGYVCGDSAYYAWATDLRSSTTYAKYPTPGQVSWTLAWLMTESRRAAANVLQANAGIHPALGQAALMYQDEAEIFVKIQQTLCGGKKLDFKEANRAARENIGDAKVREAAADLIEQALAKDKAARAALTTALKDLAPDLSPVEDDKPAPEK